MLSLKGVLKFIFSVTSLLVVGLPFCLPFSSLYMHSPEAISLFFGCNDIPVCWFQNWFLSLLRAMCLPGSFYFYPQHFLLIFYLSLFRLVSVTPTTFTNPVLPFFCSVLALFLSTILTILGFFQMLFAQSLFVSQLKSPRNSPLFGTGTLDSSSFLL